MDKQRLEQALVRNGLPSLTEVIGRKFVLEYKEPETGDWGVIAGTITGVGLIEWEGEEDHLTLYVSVSIVPTSAGDDQLDGEKIESLACYGSSECYMITTDGRNAPRGKLQLL